MKRELNENNFKRFLNDFDFLFKHIKKSNGELFLALRGSYFNIYYGGYSLAKVKFSKNSSYEITVHQKFASDNFLLRFKNDLKIGKSPNYHNIKVPKDMKKYLRIILSKKYMHMLSENILNVNNGKEISFEQDLIADNMNRDDFFIIDRQVTERGFGKQLDLLALKQIRGNKYRFLVIEVKLGKNKELRGDVNEQLQNYVDQIKYNWKNWKESYEQCYRQLKKTRIFVRPKYDEIEIVEQVEGIVVVGGYSQIGASYIKELKTKNKDLKILTFWNKIKL